MLASLILAAVAFAVGGALAEIGVRIYASTSDDFGATIRQWDPMAALIEPHGLYGYRQRPNSLYSYQSGAVARSNGAGFRGPEVAPVKPAGTIRIVLLGGSTTHGWGVEDNETIGAYLRKFLPELVPGTLFEVANLAFDGYDSYQLLERLRSDGLPLDPDIIVVNSGVNDVRNARIRDLDLINPDPRTVIWRPTLRRLREEAEQGGPTLWTRTKHHSYLARIPGLLRARVTRKNSLRSRSAVDTTLSPERSRLAVDNFVGNMEKIAQLSVSHGSALILSTPPSSLLTLYPSHKKSKVDYWIGNAETTQSFRDAFAEEMARIASARQSTEPPRRYLSVHLSDSLFLDDAHLTPDGNKVMAREFAEVMAAVLQDTLWTARRLTGQGLMSTVP